MGVLLNRVFPSWMLLACLEILLVTTVYRTFKKGIKKYKEESNETRRSSASRVERQNSPKLMRNVADTKDDSIEMVAVDVVSGTDSNDDESMKKHKKNWIERYLMSSQVFPQELHRARVASSSTFWIERREQFLWTRFVSSVLYGYLS